MSAALALNEREASALQEAGFVFERQAVGAVSPLVQTTAEYAALVGSALSVPQAAHRLGVESSRVRQRLLDHTLYGIRLKAGWRLPLFQFAEGRTVRYWEVVAPVLHGLHPVVIGRWLLAPHQDLLLGDGTVAISPRDWLELGNTPRWWPPWRASCTTGTE